MENIFSENPIFAIGTIIGLFGIFASHRLLIYRERKKLFDEATNDFRKVFIQTLTEIKYGMYGLRVFKSNEMVNILRTAYLNFRPHLHGACRNQYDKAWDRYNLHYESLGQLRGNKHLTSIDLEEDIESLLEFTQNRLLRNIVLSWKDFLFVFRLKFFGPDKETKKLIEEICNHDDKK